MLGSRIGARSSIHTHTLSLSLSTRTHTHTTHTLHTTRRARFPCRASSRSVVRADRRPRPTRAGRARCRTIRRRSPRRAATARRSPRPPTRATRADARVPRRLARRRCRSPARPHVGRGTGPNPGSGGLVSSAPQPPRIGPPEPACWPSKGPPPRPRTQTRASR
ncbi:hypothetical protein T492DRAFT_64139 [Pavlovales sp. CCMP2436]|nr:hypothetical protein T492DRAFT_64139 [Pavlovales sp. CCMP2436]